ncbi:MAG: MarR family winged helix-turn-helix transcriptional regulator [Candidatus Omnitrophota bacterium]
MTKTSDIASEISIIMPLIGRRILLDFFQSVDISQSQLLTIMAVHSKGTCRLSELSRAMEISNPTASGIVDRLVQNNYVIRTLDVNDRRAVCISLSAKGAQIAKKFQRTVQKKWYSILIELRQKDQDDFIRILRDIKERIT